MELAEIIARSAVRGPVALSAGGSSDVYYDVKSLLLSDPTVAGKIIHHMQRFIPRNYTMLAGAGYGAAIIISMISIIRGQPAILVRDGRKHGLQTTIIGKPLCKESNVVLVDDVATTGATLIYVRNHVCNFGHRVGKAVVVLDREEGAIETLASMDIELCALVKKSELS